MRTVREDKICSSGQTNGPMPPNALPARTLDSFPGEEARMPRLQKPGAVSPRNGMTGRRVETSTSRGAGITPRHLPSWLRTSPKTLPFQGLAAPGILPHRARVSYSAAQTPQATRARLLFRYPTRPSPKEAIHRASRMLAHRTRPRWESASS